MRYHTCWATNSIFLSEVINTEKVYSSVEKEALAIVKSFRKSDNLLKPYRVLVKTDLRSVAFIFADNKSKVKK